MKSSYKEVKEFIEANYVKDEDRIKKMGIIDYNDFIIDNVLGNDSFKNDVDEFYNTLAICVIMKKMNLEDDYFFSSLDDILLSYKNGDLKIPDSDKELIDSDISFIVKNS